MRKYIANIDEHTWVDFTPEQYRELNIVTMTRNDKDVVCKLIPIGDIDTPYYWICFPVKSFKLEKVEIYKC